MKTGINKVAMKDKKEGISLLVLIITIIVMIILASAVILSITGNNPISRANETKVKTDLTALKDEYNNFYSSALFDNVSNTKGYYTDKMNITKEGNIIYKGKVVNEGENNSLASIMPSIVGTEYEGKVFVADGKIYIDNRDNFLSEEQQEWAKEVGINVLNEGEVLVLSTEEVSLKISQKERIYATVMPDTDSQVEFDIDEKTKVRQLTSETNTVDIQGISDGVAILTAKVTAKDGTEIEKKVTIKVNVGDYIKVSNITINPSSVELGLDESSQLEAIITPDTADNQDVSWEVKSQRPDNAVELTDTGVVTGKDVGKATIIAKGEYGNLTSKECSVSVVDKTTITLDKKTLQLRKGEKDKLVATVDNKNVRTDTVRWETSDDTKVEVDQNGNITATGVGQATITAKYLTKTESCIVKVEEPLNLSAEVKEARGTIVTLKINADTTYSKIEKIQVKYNEKGTEEWKTLEIPVDATTYSKDDYQITGLVAEKTYDIQVIAHLVEGGEDKQVNLTAKPSKILVESVTIVNKIKSIYHGDNSYKLEAKVLPDDATNKEVRWESSKQDVATIDQEGKITPVEVGKTTITLKSADDETKEDTCEVEIQEPITFEANVEEGSITSDTIPLNIHGKTEYGKITEIKVKYKEKTETNWTEKTIQEAVDKDEYTNDNYQIAGLKPNTEYNIEVILTISSGRKKTKTLETRTDKIYVTNITLNPTSIKIPLGNTGDIQATITPENATFQGLTWESEQTNIATISGDNTATSGVANGIITAKQIGNTNVKVTSTDNESASTKCSVEVTEPIKITAQVESGSIIDEVIPVSIETSTEHGTISKIEIMYQIKETSEWKTVQVNNLGANETSYNNTYNIAGLTPNTEYNIKVKVTIASDVIGEHSKSIDNLKGKTKKRDVTELILDNDTLNVPLGNNTQKLTATILPSDATYKGVTWTSSQENIATVEGGTITTKEIGQTIITATSTDNPSAKDTCTVNVVEPISLDASIDTDNITSSAIPVKINTKTSYGTIKKIEVKHRANSTGNWTTNTVSDISTSANSYNSTYIINSGLNPNTTYEIEVTVTISTDHSYTKTGLSGKTEKIAVTGITVSPTSKEITYGEITSFSITATIQPSNATYQGVSWNSNNTGVATVDTNGKVTINGSGTATITAKSTDDTSKSATCTVTVTKPVAQIGSKKYGTLQAAFDSITTSTSTTVNILRDINKNNESMATLPNNRYVTLNLSNYEVTSTGTTITNNGNLTINGGGTVSSSGGNAVNNVGTVTLSNNPTIETSANSEAIYNTGNVNVYSGTVESDNSHGIYNGSTSSYLYISGGYITGYDGVRANGELYMSGGEINSKGDDAIELESGNVEIIDGSITGEYGIYYTDLSEGRTLTLGADDGYVDTSWPKINVNNTAVYNGSDTFTAYFYDGSVTGSSQFDNESEVIVPDDYEIVVNGDTATLGKKVTGITLDQTSKTIVKGNTNSFTITATVSPSDAVNKGINWTTDNSSVATVNSSGTVTIAGGLGTANIKATSQDNNSISATCTVTVKDAVAKVGSTYYATLQDAFNASSTNSGSASSITLLKSTSETLAFGSSTQSRYATLSLGSYTITGTLTKYGNLTISGSSGTITKATSSSIISNNSGTLTLNSGVTISNTSSGRTITNSSGTLNISGATVTKSGSSYETIYNNGGTLNMTSGTISTSTTSSNAIEILSGNVTITGGKINNSTSSTSSGNSNYPVFIRGGTFTLGSATSSSSTNPTVTNNFTTGTAYGVYNSSGTFNFNSGSVKGHTTAIYGTATPRSGCNVLVSKDTSGYETATVGEAVAYLYGSPYKYFATLQAAFDYQSSTAEIYLLKNINNEILTVKNGYDIILDLEKHTISSTSTNQYVITNNGRLELHDGIVSSTGYSVINNVGSIFMTSGSTVSTTASNPAINNTGTVDVLDVTVSATNSHGIFNASTTAKLTVEGGKVEGYDGVRANGTVNITRGEVHSITDDAIEFATGTITITGGSITGGYGIYNSNGGTASTKVLTIGTNGGEPSTTTPAIDVTKGYAVNNSSNFTVNFYDGYVKTSSGNSPFSSQSAVNVPDGYEIVVSSNNKATLQKSSYGTNGNTEIGVARVNKPELLDGMTPIKFNTSGGVITTNTTDKDWYAYKNQGNYLTDGKTSHWANAQTKDGSQWVWIPRYAYKINYTNSSDKSQASEIDIIFLKGTSKTEYIDSSGTTHTTLPSGYIVHPAFTNESGSSYKNGGWDKELTGIWVAKYEASQNSSAEKESTLNRTYPKFIPNASSYVKIKIGDIFTLCKNLAKSSSNPYGFSSSTVDTHQMKNSEWGAVAYLAQSKYGRNGVEVTQNKYDGKSAKTGYGENTSAAYNTTNGQKASTTGNIYGIYDMSGGVTEYTAGYLNSNLGNLTTYGLSLLGETNTRTGADGTSTKYVSVYKYNEALSDSSADNYNESTNKARKGEAIWETSTSGSGTTSWFGDFSSFVNGGTPFLLRGGHYENSGTTAGLFYFISVTGDAVSYHGFRAVCVSK